MKQRVVITGMGVVTPIGCDVVDFGRNLLAGVSGVGPITLFDPAALRTRIAAEVRTSLPNSFRDRKVTFACEAARQALAAATACGTQPGGSAGGARAGLSLGMGLELFAMEDLVASRRPDFVPPQSLAQRLTFLQTPSDLCVHLISHTYGLGQPPLTHTSACAAGTDALGAAFHLVRSGRRRWMLAGGTDSMINPMGVGGFCKIGATSTANDAPTRASRPFDRNRDGFVLGEGAAMLVLESLDDARPRGATIHAEIVGYGNSFDAHGISEPHPEGRGAWQAMARCLADAGVGPEDIDAINAHGSSTPKNDVMETLAIKRLLGARSARVPISSTKSMIGHLIAAAGAVEAVAAILGMQAGEIHPTINLDEPDPACDLDCVPRQARRHEQRYVLSNSFGFGGQNAAILLRNGRMLDD
jgi:3-oxoacyl-[acyl-carrier-protein] synthase II